MRDGAFGPRFLSALNNPLPLTPHPAFTATRPLPLVGRGRGGGQHHAPTQGHPQIHT